MFVFPTLEEFYKLYRTIFFGVVLIVSSLNFLELSIHKKHYKIKKISLQIFSHEIKIKIMKFRSSFKNI